MNAVFVEQPLALPGSAKSLVREALQTLNTSKPKRVFFYIVQKFQVSFVFAYFDALLDIKWRGAVSPIFLEDQVS